MKNLLIWVSILLPTLSNFRLLLTTIVKLYHSELYYKRSELHANLFLSGMSKMAIMRRISESTSMSLRS